MFQLGQIVGGLVPTFLVSRLLLWLMRSWQGGVQRIALAHAVSLLLAALIGGMGMADGGSFAPLEAALAYSVPQGVWCLFDFVRHARTTNRPKNGAGPNGNAAAQAMLDTAPQLSLAANKRDSDLLRRLGVFSLVLLFGIGAIVLLIEVQHRATLTVPSSQISAEAHAESAEAEFMLECNGVSGQPEQFQAPPDSVLERIGARRSILRLVQANMTADWTDYNNRPFIVADHSYAPSPLIATINACTSSTGCEVLFDNDRIQASVRNENGYQLFRISRATGEYFAMLEWPPRPDLERSEERWQEVGRCVLTSRAF